MTISVPLAIRNAVASARADADTSSAKWYPIGNMLPVNKTLSVIFLLLDGPTTIENVYMNSLNDYTQYVL